MKKKLQESHPAAFFLDPTDPEGLEKFLLRNARISSNEQVVEVEKPGKGNMNCVVRVRTNERSIILKQARPWVEKYPQIPAPIERIKVEAIYLEHMQSKTQTATMTPVVLWKAEEHFMVAMEDLGEASDLTSLYINAEDISTSTLDVLTDYLRALHTMSTPSPYPSNMSMRKLNHEHIFRFPFDPYNGLQLDDIQSGLSALADPFLHNVTLKQLITSLGLIYLTDGHSLLHGDFYPGSWLDTEHGLKVIDPEFSFLGIPEFDLGVMMAHMFLASQPTAVISTIWQNYEAPPAFELRLMSGFAGVEILRRLIGIAQLPLSLSLEQKQDLMQLAKEFIENGALNEWLGD